MLKEFRVGGMTCINCQSKIENKLKSMAGVKSVSVSFRDGIVKIEFDEKRTSFKRIEREIKNLGYEVLDERSADKANMLRAICFLAVIIVLYIILQQFGILNLLVPSMTADSTMGYGMLFVVGLLTSVHCIAMCGGINLSQCLPDADQGNSEKKKTSLMPSVLYNLGRVISYTFIGFILGLLGWLVGGSAETGVGIPTLLQGYLKLIAGALMVIMGINMLGIFPWLRKINIRMPRFFRKKAVKNTRPLVVGLLNGLMPCGPLQSIQILALASANPFSGALAMFLFSLGTVPLMFGLGSLVSAIGKRFTHTVMNVGSVLVTVLGFAMISQGGSLSGLISSEMLLFLMIGISVIGFVTLIPLRKKITRVISAVTAAALVIAVGVVWKQAFYGQNSAGSDAEVENGVQTVNSTLDPGRYPTITVQQGVPVVWNIDAPEGSINGCNYKMIIQEYGIEHAFSAGENIIEFTPAESGTFTYTCWMGMIKGNIIVTELTESGSDISDAETTDSDPDVQGDVQVLSKGEYLTIPLSDITEDATFYSAVVDGVTVDVFAVKASDGTVRTSFNACQMCYTSGRGYYIQNGKYLTCQNCGSRFTADQVGILSGGCNPVAILDADKTVTEDSILISYEFLKENLYFWN